MIFLLRAVFWVVVVAVLVPGAFQGTGNAATSQTLETLRTDTLTRLVRVRAELNARDLRGP